MIVQISEKQLEEFTEVWHECCSDSRYNAQLLYKATATGVYWQIVQNRNLLLISYNRRDVVKEWNKVTIPT